MNDVSTPKYSWSTVAIAVSVSLCAMLPSSDANADQYASQSDFGGVGLMQMPTARFADYGTLSGLYYDNEEYRRLALSIQLFPWLETTIRYNDIRPITYSGNPEFSGDQTGKDKGFDVKARLLEESYWLPQVAVGWRDLAGTGIFASEYVVASKQFGPLDVTLGIGWGYMGRRDNISNPFCEVSDKFCERTGGYSGRGGRFETDKWFRGDAAVFGGFQYQTPFDPLVLKAEYDGNDYSRERYLNQLQVDSAWNVGADYKVNDHWTLKLSYERGNTLMFGFSGQIDLNSLGQVKTANRRVPTPNTTTALSRAESQDDKRRLSRMARDFYTFGGLAVREMQHDRSENSEDVDTLRVYGQQLYYRDSQEGIRQVARVAEQRLPKDYKFVEVVEQHDQIQLNATKIDLEVARTAIQNLDLSTELEQAFTRKNVDLEQVEEEGFYEAQYKRGWPRFSIRPFLDQSFGNPENFYMYQLGLDLNASMNIGPGTFVTGTVSGNLMTNFDDFNFLVDSYRSPLPRVRTYVREYVTFSDIWLDNLQVSHVNQLAPNVYTSVYGGYLERMFGGVGTELLYRELDSNWAVGVDLNWVKQRDYESHTGFLDYDTFTGHITGYYEPRFMPNTLIKAAYGKFLAQDNGLQLNVEHKFKSGVIVGAYAAKTNVSSREYGEGSFTKGFYISFPIDILQTEHSPNRGFIGWTPLTRDGGQMLGRRVQLFHATDLRSPYYKE
ncbi:YjbH domain-containing protein [Pseudidiomarina terrestris]|uniref:YjbH domain-containing protein n=1 Tax=Pseudidiomarina terrestris TaxID=2820060 RepID=A0AAW7R1P3_9GAMM|nr:MULTISPECIES: YjbH domain-containing protein [unclassified Pseudidiomarina]MDN7124459.1 YjbH domain-containing protein [Pseudidiomarina sp. 1APP75-32.1]MDN7129250.1 YjbH domain-containing protein [Pseudidiomarina sp. 1APR75-15]MDN7134484.1 YjbH domain-containing protein [Pseudidiomarina sp. 1ASP75-5]MEA3587721.1 YjbH domain-containing protein [Pseudidiomarina sp. 1APP75-27a]